MSELNLSVINATHISSTIYLFGFDPESNTPLVFAHRSTNSFKSEQIAKQLPRARLKPTDGIDLSTLRIKDDDDAAHTMLKQIKDGALEIQQGKTSKKLRITIEGELKAVIEHV